MIKLCIVCPIFLPNEEILRKCINSISSLNNLKMNNEKIEIDFHFSGWSYKKEYWDKLDPIINLFNPIQYIKQDKNYGKSYNVNILIDTLYGYDYIFTMDTDIILMSEYDYLHCLLSILSKDKISVISFNQKENNCHLFQRLDQKEIIDKYSIKWNNDQRGVAGGCIAIDFNFWKMIGGYRTMGVYAGDDAFLFIDCLNNNTIGCLVENVYVIHPKENNIDYQNWKVNNCRKYTDGKDKDLENSIEDSMKFWKT